MWWNVVFVDNIGRGEFKHVSSIDYRNGTGFVMVG